MTRAKRNVIGVTLGVVLTVLSVFFPKVGRWIDEVNMTIDEVQTYKVMSDGVIRKQIESEVE